MNRYGWECIGCAIVLLLGSFFMTGCGAAINDRQAMWCVEDARVGEAARQAAFEWKMGSGGEVDFQVRMAHDCAGEWPRIIVTDEEQGGDMSAHGEMEVLRYFAETKGEERTLTLIVMHEMGHYLTGADHSDDARDVMHGLVDDDTCAGLTARDKARLDRTSREITSSYPTGF